MEDTTAVGMLQPLLCRWCWAWPLSHVRPCLLLLTTCTMMHASAFQTLRCDMRICQEASFTVASLKCKDVATEVRLVWNVQGLCLVCTKALFVSCEWLLGMMSRSGRVSVVVQEGQQGAARASRHQECLWRALQHRPGLCSRACS